VELWADCCLVKSGSFRVLRYKADSWSCVQTLPRTRLRLWLPKARMAISSCKC